MTFSWMNIQNVPKKLADLVFEMQTPALLRTKSSLQTENDAGTNISETEATGAKLAKPSASFKSVPPEEKSVSFDSAFQEECDQGFEEARIPNDEMSERGDDLEVMEECCFLLSHRIGRRFICRMLEETGVFRSDYVVNQPDTRLPFFEGQRNVGLMLYHRCLTADKSLFCKTLIEGE